MSGLLSPNKTAQQRMPLWAAPRELVVDPGACRHGSTLTGRNQETGAGPAGLIAAERLSENGYSVVVIDRMPSPARKFLMAGRGGLNLTHSEDLTAFLARYRQAEPFLAALIQEFPPERLRRWCEGLGEETFVGSSGRVFPKSMKASPLLPSRALKAL